MPRYRFLIEYDGGPFHGWQLQASGLTVQGVMEAALAKLEGGPVAVYGSGRTDAGVHALGQCAHADLTRAWQPFVLMNALNFHVRPHPVSIRAASEAAQDFHARFSAIRRRYLYRILNRRPDPALERGRVWHVPQPLGVEAMSAAAAVLVGKHDFTTFRSAQCQAKSPVKTLDRLAITRAGEEIHIEAEARSFLHHQVRSMVGTLKRVGEGQWTAHDVRAALEAKDRARCGPVAPPEGLYLVEVGYPAG
jgi:tRNA pseudouridine38-40 synthase